MERDFRPPRILLKGLYRWGGVAVFNAGRIGTNKTRPLLNVALAEILGFSQLT